MFWSFLINIFSQSTVCLANVQQKCRIGQKCVQVMVYWVNITSNDKRIFTYVHLSKNDMDGTHSKPWRSSAPKQHKIAGKLNGPKKCFFFYVLIHQFPELIQSVPSLAPGVEQFLAAVDVAVSSWKPMYVVYAVPKIWRSTYNILHIAMDLRGSGFVRRGLVIACSFWDHSRWLFHMRNQCPAAPHNPKIQRVLNDVGIAGCFSISTSETCFKTRYPVPLKKNKPNLVVQ